MKPWERTSSGDQLDWTGLGSVSPRWPPERCVDLLKISTLFLIRARHGGGMDSMVARA